VFFGRRTSSTPPPSEPSHLRLRRHLRTISVQLEKVAVDVASGRVPTLAADLVRDPSGNRALFIDLKEGVEIGAFYYFTDDFKTCDANAQVGIMQFFGRLLGLEAIAQRAEQPNAPGGGAGLTRLLDVLRSEALFFDMFLGRLPISAEILLRQKSNDEINTEIARLREQENERFLQLIKTVFDVKATVSALPKERMPFVMQVEQRVVEGSDRFINGVFFPQEMANKLLKVMAERQARSIATERSA
jgi:hypothetical protein